MPAGETRAFPPSRKPAGRLAVSKKLDRTSSILPEPEPALLADARGHIAPDGLALDVTWTAPPGHRLPPRFKVNAGYEIVAVNGVPARQARERGEDPSETRVELALTPADPDAATVEFSIRGMPSPPGVRFGDAEIELDGLATWLPVPVPPEPLRWNCDLTFPTGMTAVTSTTLSGVTAIAIRGAAHLRHDSLPETFGACGAAELRLGASLVQRGVALWSRFLPELSQPTVRIAIVNRPRSTFCYTRPGLIRLASGVLRGPPAAVVVHEAGHLWWGTRAVFADDAHWVAESLAEYGLHLACDAGTYPDYRRATLDALRTLNDGRLPRDGLAALSGSPGKVAAFILRAKGGFAVAALRKTLGEDAFRDLLYRLDRAACRGALTSAGFLALAATVSGRSLTTFARRWVD